MSKRGKVYRYKAKAQVKMSMPFIVRLAKSVSKEEFLAELKKQWQPFVTEHSTLNDEMEKVGQRIKKSGMKKAFEIVHIIDADIAQVLKEIRREKFGD